MYSNINFHPKLIIDDHFEKIINEIDINTEKQLCDQNLNYKEFNVLNEIRDEQLKKITKLKNDHLSLANTNDDYDGLNSKYDAASTFGKNIEIIKEKLISIDCLLMKDSESKSGISLWLTRWFFDEEHLKFIKYMFFLYN